MIRHFLLLTLFISAISAAYAQEGQNPAASLDWQRAHLQEILDQRIKRVLSPHVPEHKLMVETSVQLEQKSVRPRIRLTRPKGSEEVRGLFPLSKLGLWIDTEALQENEKLKKPENIFSNIKEIRIFIAVDQLYAEKKDIVKKTTEETIGRLGKFKFTVDVEDMLFAQDEKRWTEYVFDFRLPLGILISTFLLMFLALLISARHQKLEQRKMVIMESAQNKELDLPKNGGVDSGVGEEEEEEEAEYVGLSTVVGSNDQFKGIAQFQSLISGDLERATNLVKQWISIRGGVASEGLILLPNMVSMDSLKGLFEKLTEEERKEWKQIIAQPTKPGFERRGDGFVLSQIVGDLLEPPIPVEQEIRDLLAGITPEESVLCAQKDPFLGAIFANTLSTAQVARMFLLLSKESADVVVEQSINFKFEDVSMRFTEIKETVEKIREEQHVDINPLLEKTIDLIREVGPAKEGTFFRAIARCGEEALLREAARQFFPSEAIGELPKQVLRTCLRKLSLTFRAELIVSLDEKMQPDFINALGAEGTKLRDLMESEILQVKEDKQRIKQIKKAREDLWASFVQVCRQTIKDDPELVDAADEVIQLWVATQMEMANRGSKNVA